jgi:5-methylcytosine-specific restriction endonuclease McrA
LTSTNGPRRPCPHELRPQILEAQGYACLYCSIPFGSVIRRGRRLLVTVVHWDHVVPLAYLQANPNGNWAAACMVCNRIKSDELFTDFTEMRAWIDSQWESRNIECVWRALVSAEEDPRAWAVKFAKFLANQPRDLRLGGLDATQLKAAQLKAAQARRSPSDGTRQPSVAQLAQRRAWLRQKARNRAYRRLGDLYPLLLERLFNEELARDGGQP